MFINHALTPMWKIIDNEAFGWSLGILADDEKVARAHQIGKNLAEAAKDIEYAHDTLSGKFIHADDINRNNGITDYI